MTYYHGGPEIEGRWILPPSLTGQSRVCHGSEYVCITPSYSLALTYAATCDGIVYEVRPKGPLGVRVDALVMLHKNTE